MLEHLKKQRINKQKLLKIVAEVVQHCQHKFFPDLFTNASTIFSDV